MKNIFEIFLNVVISSARFLLGVFFSSVENSCEENKSPFKTPYHDEADEAAQALGYADKADFVFSDD